MICADSRRPGRCVACGFYTLVLGIFFGPVATLGWLFTVRCFPRPAHPPRGSAWKVRARARARWLRESGSRAQGFGALSYEGIVQDTFKIGIVVLGGDSVEFLVDLYYEFMDFMPFQI